MDDKLAAEMFSNISRYEKENHLSIVEANNTKERDKRQRVPLIKCPEMVYPETCFLCIWYDLDKDVCGGGF